MINVNDIMNQLNVQQQQSCLLRKPTEQELDTFISRVLHEKDETPYSLFQSLKFKLEQQVHSPAEAEIIPLVLERIVQLYGNKDNN